MKIVPVADAEVTEAVRKTWLVLAGGPALAACAEKQQRLP